MKNILVPTDFSAHAEYAVQVAMEMAAKFGATLHLLTCLDISKWDISHSTKEEKSKYQDSLELVNSAEKYFQQWKEVAHTQHVAIKTSWVNGRLIPNIMTYTASQKIDGIVMGSHGTNQNFQSSLGSNTQRVIRRVNCPVFVIKSPLEKITFSNVVFASGFDGSESEVIAEFLRFIQPFEPDVIHLLQIDTSPWFTSPKAPEKEVIKNYQTMVEKECRCETHLYTDYSIEAGIRHFSDDTQVDLIVISNHHRRPWRQFLVGSNVEDLVRSTERPLLCFDYASVKEPM